MAGADTCTNPLPAGPVRASGNLDMTRRRTFHILLALVGCGYGLCAQPLTIASSYSLSTGFSVAPGQLVTLIVAGLTSNVQSTVRAPAGADLPDSLNGIIAGYAQLGPTRPATPILEFHPYPGCGVW